MAIYKKMHFRIFSSTGQVLNVVQFSKYLGYRVSLYRITKWWLEEDKTTNVKILYYGWEHPNQDALV